MKKYIGAVFVAAGLLFSVNFTAQAAGLTEVQIQAIVSLASSFGADASTVKNVEASLRGQTATGSIVSTPSNTGTCLTLSRDLYIGRSDAQTNGEVSKLQSFLLANGYGDPDGDSGFLLQKATGYYGSMTATAVVKWQKAHGMDYVTPKSGVGSTTRGKMKCKGTGALPITKVEWRIEPANPGATDSYKKDEQAIFIDVIRSDNSIRGYSVGKAYGCTASSNVPAASGISSNFQAVPSRKVLGSVNCYYALSGVGFTAYETLGQLSVVRGDESARDGGVVETTVLDGI